MLLYFTFSLRDAHPFVLRLQPNMRVNANPAHNPEAPGEPASPRALPHRTALPECADRASEEELLIPIEDCAVSQITLEDLQGTLDRMAA